MLVAIVPAAGKSQRMGHSKLLLPLGPRRVIEHVLAALAGSRIDQTIVVVPPDATELRAIVRTHGAEVAQLTDPTADMRTSVVYGLDRAEQLWGNGVLDAFLVALADQPTLSSRTVDCLIARSHSSGRSIFIPTFGGKRGHPVLFGWKHVEQVRSLPADRGLNCLIARLPSEVEECPIDEAGLLEDLDTPQDYERLKMSRDWR
ncbi:MAG: nucleotidyltransferase family protein [Planctomycetes bacterium]|nr:nucleotidyltransferase family protein [Planctomycetota bacterium]